MNNAERTLLWAGVAGWGIGFMLVCGAWMSVLCAFAYGYGGMRWFRLIDKRRKVQNG